MSTILYTEYTRGALRKIISLGWPESRAQCPAHLIPFWDLGDELRVEDATALDQIHNVQCHNGGGEFREGGGVQDSYTFQYGLVGSFTSPGIDTRSKGATVFSVSSEINWQSGVNRIVKVPKRSFRSGIRSRPGPSGRQCKPTL